MNKSIFYFWPKFGIFVKLESRITSVFIHLCIYLFK